MKIFASFLLIILSFSLYAQYEFAPIGTEWYYNKMLSYNPPEAGYVKLTSIKDSIIENKNVRVIEVLFVSDDTTQIVEGYEYIHQSDDTIWYWKGNQFHVLYNFSMQKGDSILLYSEMLNQCTENDPYGWNLVDSVFTNTFNNIELKCYSSIPINNSVWGFEQYCCEIVGNLKYLIPQNKDCVYDGIWYGPLRCYSDPINGVLITSLPAVKCDSTYTYTGPVSVALLKRTGKLSIYPNPVSCEITVTGYDFYDQSYEIKIINIKGDIVNIYYSDINIIDVSNLTNGIYFLTISINQKIIDYEKFIKI